LFSKVFSKKGLLIFFGAIILYAVLIFYSDTKEFTEKLQSIKAEIIPLIFLASFASFTIRGIRQYFLLKTIGVNISLKNNFQLYFAGLSMLITPGGSGEVVKNVFLREKFNVPISKTAPLVPAERLHDFLAIVTLLGFTLFFFNSITTIIVFIIGVILISIIFFIFTNSISWNFIKEKIAKRKFFQKVIPDFSESKESMKKLTSIETTARAWAISILGITVESIAVYLSFVALEINMDFLLEIQLVYSSGLMGVLTLLPGGLGVTEGSMIGLLVTNGISLSLASVVVLLIRFSTLWFATVIGFISAKKFLN